MRPATRSRTGVCLRVFLCMCVALPSSLLLLFLRSPRLHLRSPVAHLSWVKEMYVGNSDSDKRHTVVQFLEACSQQDLRPFLVDPQMLERLGAREVLWRSAFWTRQEGEGASLSSSVAFGIIDPPFYKLDRLSKVFSAKTHLFRHVIYGTDPRGVLASSFLDSKDLPTIPLHFLWWSRDRDGGVLRLQLVFFWTRGNNLWLGPLHSSPWGNTSEDNQRWGDLPFPVSRWSVGQQAAFIEKFSTLEETVAGINVWVPANIPSFLSSLQNGLSVECSHDTARYMVSHYRPEKTQDPDYRNRILKVLAITATTLDRMGLTFWISSGTALGWYRQCDVIPYTSDLDIEMRIEDYSPNITTALVKAGLRQQMRFGKVSDSFELRFGRFGVNMDIFFRYEEKDHYWFGMYNPSSLQKFRYVFPKYSLRWAEFGGLKVRVPYPPELYIQALYGKDWTIPKENFHWLFGAFNKVPAGKWSEQERSQVHKTFLGPEPNKTVG